MHAIRIDRSKPLAAEAHTGHNRYHPEIAPVLEVAGIVDSGFYDYDSSWAYISLEAARRLYGAGDTATVIEVRVSDPERLDDIRPAIAEAVEGHQVTDMVQMNKTFFAALRTEKLSSAPARVLRRCRSRVSMSSCTVAISAAESTLT